MSEQIGKSSVFYKISDVALTEYNDFDGKTESSLPPNYKKYKLSTNTNISDTSSSFYSPTTDTFSITKKLFTIGNVLGDSEYLPVDTSTCTSITQKGGYNNSSASLSSIFNFTNDTMSSFKIPIDSSFTSSMSSDSSFSSSSEYSTTAELSSLSSDLGRLTAKKKAPKKSVQKKKNKKK